MERRDISIQFVNLSLKSLEGFPGRKFELCSVCKNNNNIFCRNLNITEHRVSVQTILTISTRFSVSTISTILTWFSISAWSTVLTVLTILTIFTLCLSELNPSCTIIVRNIPIVVLNLQLWCNTILTISTWLTVISRSTWLTIRTWLAICTCCRNSVACLILQPFSVQGPIIHSIDILLDTNYRSMTILTICTIHTVCSISTRLSISSRFSIYSILSISSVENSHSTTLGKGYGITHLHAILIYREDRYHVILVLKSRHNFV